MQMRQHTHVLHVEAARTEKETVERAGQLVPGPGPRVAMN